jgi:hypothetical protein
VSEPVVLGTAATVSRRAAESPYGDAVGVVERMIRSSIEREMAKRGLRDETDVVISQRRMKAIYNEVGDFEALVECPLDDWDTLEIRGEQEGIRCPTP